MFGKSERIKIMKWYESIFFGAIGGLIFEILKYLIGGI